MRLFYWRQLISHPYVPPLCPAIMQNSLTIMPNSGATINRNINRNEFFCAIVTTPFGAVGIRTGDALLRELVYLPPGFAAVPAKNALAELAAQQIACYCEQPDFCFDLPLAPVGTAFQRRVWQAIAAIPRGQVQTYGQLATQLQSAPRAVGQACGANWFPLVIACHRVVGAQGVGGFSGHADAAGFHVGVKRWLLTHEGWADNKMREVG